MRSVVYNFIKKNIYKNSFLSFNLIFLCVMCKSISIEDTLNQMFLCLKSKKSGLYTHASSSKQQKTGKYSKKTHTRNRIHIAISCNTIDSTYKIIPSINSTMHDSGYNNKR